MIVAGALEAKTREDLLVLAGRAAAFPAGVVPEMRGRAIALIQGHARQLKAGDPREEALVHLVEALESGA